MDGVYSADPVKDPTAVKYDSISYDEVLAQHLMVMDTTATSLSMDNHIPVLLFALKDPENIIRALCGENVGRLDRMRTVRELMDELVTEWRQNL